MRSLSVQEPRDVSRTFTAALPLTPVSLRARAAWWLLLNLLRIPGAARLLVKLRRGA
jgi:hypothetical protein